MQEPLGLTEWQVEEETQRQRGLDGLHHQVEGLDADELLELSDRFKQQNAPAAVVLGSTEDGRVHVIEANPNPWLSSRTEFPMAARKSGRTYTELIGEIVELAMARPEVAPSKRRRRAPDAPEI